MSARTREVAERLVAALVAPAVSIPVVLGSDEAALPEDYVAITAADISPDGLGGYRCAVAVTANVPGDANGMDEANAAEHALLAADLDALNDAAAETYGQPTGFVRAWEVEGREDTPTDGGRTLCSMVCAVSLPLCEDAANEGA